MSVAPANAFERGSKTFYSGTHRVIQPDATLGRLRPLMPLLGITRIANITGLDRVGIPVCMVCRPNARSLSVSQGKGCDLASAKASGVMESLETYHAEYVSLPLKLASYDELRFCHSVPDPMKLPQPKQGQWHSSAQMLWVEGCDWISMDAVWVPFELVHLNATVQLPGYGYFVANSSGLASGNHMLEAVSHGICELVERDALALWRMNRPSELRRVELESVDDPGCNFLLQKFCVAGVSIGVWDVTSDVGIATYFCCAIDGTADEFYPAPVAVGSGCHPSRSIAFCRALTEAAQTRATLIAGSRDDLSSKDYKHVFSPETANAWRTLMQADASCRFADAPTFESDNLQDDLDWELQQLRKCGLDQVIVVDLTKPEFDVPVARVVIPGLEADRADRKWGARSEAFLKGRSHR